MLRVSLLPPNSTWNLKMMVSKRNLLFQGLLFRFHVEFQECINLNKRHPKIYPSQDGTLSSKLLAPLASPVAWSLSWKPRVFDGFFVGHLELQMFGTPGSYSEDEEF